jgi:CheY-like chemotaxis protein
MAGRAIERLLENTLEDPMLVPLDLKLPGPRRPRDPARMRAADRTAPVPVVILTTPTSPPTPLALTTTEANAHVRKQVNTEEFADAVDPHQPVLAPDHQQPPTPAPVGAAQRAGGVTRR